MILVIDTTKREQIILGLYDGQQLKCYEFETEKQSEDLLAAIEGILNLPAGRQEEKLSLKDIEKILVNLGPGSYTGSRAGVTVANTLGWILNIPVFGYKEGEQEKTLAKISKNKESKFSKIVLPLYA